MAKHVYPPFGVGVADTSSIDLTLDVTRIITANAIYGGSGGDFGVADNIARSDHTHITSYDGRYVLKAGDTMTGNLTIQKADPVLFARATSGNPIILVYDTTNGGVALYTVSGSPAIGKVNAAGAITADYITLNKTTGAIGLLGATTVTTGGLTVTAGGLVVSASGFTVTGNSGITGNLTLTSGIFSTITKGNLFGQSTGVNTALTQADAAILLYANAANNWAGFGADSSGGVWTRTGTSGTPDYRTYVDAAGKFWANGAIQAAGAAILSSTLAVTGAVTLTNLGGSGNRVVQADNSGVLSVPAAPTITDLTNLNHTHLSAAQGGLLNGAAGATVVFLYSSGASGSVSSFSLPNNTFSGSYELYTIFIWNLAQNTASASLYWRGRTSGTDDSGANTYKSRYEYLSGSGTQNFAGLSSTLAYILPGITSGTWASVSTVLTVRNPANASFLTMVQSNFEGVAGGVDWEGGWTSGQYTTAKTHDSLSIVPSSGTFSFSGLSVYGWRLS